MAAEPYPYSTMVAVLEYWSSHESHRPAFVFVDKKSTRFELTRGQLYELGARWAAVLQDEGVGRKDMVVSTLPNGPERALCDVGIVMAGAVMVNAQCQLADGSDLLRVLRQSKARAVCVDPDRDLGPWQVLKQHVKHDPVTNTVTSHSLPDLRKVFFIRRTAPLCQDAAVQISTGDAEPTVKDGDKESCLKDSFSSAETGDFIAGLQALNKFYKAEVAADETVVVFTTSGSTGFSKLVPQTHRSILKCCQFLGKGSFREFSMVFNCAPLGWLGGYVFLYLATGRGRLLLDMWFGPVPPDDLAFVVWDNLARENCSGGSIMPFLLCKIIALEDRNAWKMKSVLIAGQPVKTELIRQALQLSEAVAVSYASTELLMTTAVLVVDASSYQDFLVGKPLPGNTVKICDRDGNEVSRGSKGDIYAKTQYMFEGYLNSPEDTKAAFTADGFLKTGDTGMMLEDGSLLVEGRQQDTIHRGSYIFYPGWLESRIMESCPGLHDVIVVGVPDPEMGEEICACFVPSDPSVTEEYVRSLVEEDILATLDDPLSPRPRYYLSFQAFPKTYTDKPLRRDVRRQATERLSLA